MDSENLNCHDVIVSYEGLIKELTQELHGVKSHHDELKSQLSTLVLENQNLTQKLHEVSRPKSQQVMYRDQDELVGNLKAQIDSLVEEKNYLSSLWKESMETVRVLEQELEVHMAGRDLNVVPKREMEKLKQGYEEKILKLKLELERPNTKNLPVPQSQTSSDLLTASKFKQIVQNLEEEILTLQKRLQDGENGRKKLEKVLREKEVLILDVLGANGSYREKVLEAVKVVEEALQEKEAAISREKQARGELQEFRQGFERKLEDSQGSFAALQSKLEEESKLKSLEIEKLQAKCSLLENHMELLQSERLQFQGEKPSRSPNDDGSYANKLLVLEKNLESTFQKLLVSEKQNIQLSSEKETLKNDMGQMAEHYERTLKTKEIERVTFQSRLKQLETKLEQSQDDCKQLRDQLNTTVEEWKKRVEEREKSITKQLTDELDQMRRKTNEDTNQLRACLEAKDKFVKETRIVLENLEKLAVNLKRENRKLKSELRECQNKHEQYRNVLKLVHDDVDRITTKAVDDGGGKSRL